MAEKARQEEVAASGYHASTNKKPRALNTGAELASSSSLGITVRVFPPQSIQCNQSFTNVPRDVSKVILEPVNLTIYVTSVSYMLAGITDVSHHTWQVHSSHQAAVGGQKERQSTSTMSLGSQSINAGVTA